MMDPTSYKTIVSGERRDPFAVFCRLLFSGIEIPYSMVTAIRNLSYDRKWKKIRKLPVPVISVGNLTLGGTGKTPFVAWLIRKFRAMGLNPAVASRGYHADQEGWNDETRELALYFPGLPQAISPDRYTSSLAMLENAEKQGQPVDLVILDDGFQHRQLHRDFDVILLDAVEPFGYGRLFPRGMLRESISSLKRADAVVLSHANLVSQSQAEEIRHQIQQVKPELCWCEMTHKPDSLLNSSGEMLPISALGGKNVVAFCGIGNPEHFRQTLLACNMRIEHFLEFPDHCAYDSHDRLKIKELHKKYPTSVFVCTVKDYVKLLPTEIKVIPFSALTVTTEFLAGEEAFLRLIEKL